MGAGEFDKRIWIEHCVEARSSTGATTLEWATFAIRWAKREVGAGNEQFAGDQRTSVQSAKFKIRHVAGVTPKMRVTCEGQTYEIDDVAEPDRRRHLILSCHTVSPHSRP